MTKNNLQNKNIESEQQHFGLRKLSVGVASVLLSTTIFFGVNAAVSSVSNVVNADVVVDKSSDPMSVMTANQFGLDSNVSSFSYLGHSTTKNDNGQTQDVYKFVDHNDNISNDRIFKIYGIQGLDSGKLTITYQPSNKNGIPLSGSKSTTAGFNAGKTAQNVGNEIPVRLKESDLGWTHDILVTVSMTRAQEQNPAIIGGIAGASNRSTATAFDLSNAVKVASPKAHTTYSPDTRVEIDNRTDAEKTDPKVPEKTGVDDVKHLTDTEKDQVKQKVEEANKGNFPEGTTVTVADDGTATISYPDKSTDTIPGGQLVQQKTDADKIDPKVPEKTGVEDTQHLTDAEKDQVKQKVEEANKGNFP
ncbi:MAG: YSIRK-type signal peptide-containing protein, partial [Limosilactobacillus sp.]|uniref:YSIRK-type signal peptide-containing protein n=1 Tax=Limosilactobacillus sp. TaxID=2773925 RepID=UPI0026F6C1B0|nr:YSIRK-type signal peptide-containing protein [Limosilactobacillus sp.]